MAILSIMDGSSDFKALQSFFLLSLWLFCSTCGLRCSLVFCTCSLTHSPSLSWATTDCKVNRRNPWTSLTFLHFTQQSARVRLVILGYWTGPSAGRWMRPSLVKVSVVGPSKLNRLLIIRLPKVVQARGGQARRHRTSRIQVADGDGRSYR